MPSQDYSAENIFVNLAFLHGFYPPANNVVVPGGWSIGTEMIFYIIFPFIFSYFRKYRNSARVFLIPFTLLILNFLINYWLQSSYNNYKLYRGFFYFNIINQLPVFLLGMYCYFKRDLIFRKNFNQWIIGIITFVVLGFSVLLHQKIDNIVIKTTLGAVVFLLVFISFVRIKSLSTKVVGRIGELSFSIYLFHFLFAWHFANRLYPRINLVLSPSLIFLTIFFITIAGSVVFAIISEKVIEKPGISAGHKIIGKLKAATEQVS